VFVAVITFVSLALKHSSLHIEWINLLKAPALVEPDSEKRSLIS
jgi:hypothetical protein